MGVGRANQFDAKLSPTGRWLTATSEETSRREIMAQTFPEPRNRLQVSANGGQRARWRKDGRELYFISANRQLMAVDVDEQAGRFGVPHALFDTLPWRAGGSPVLYDVSPDGQRFLMVRPRPDASVPRNHRDCELAVTVAPLTATIPLLGPVQAWRRKGVKLIRPIKRPRSRQIQSLN